jgi:photosystem II stability/assembly factor-like uncharacterized protein
MIRRVPLPTWLLAFAAVPFAAAFLDRAPEPPEPDAPIEGAPVWRPVHEAEGGRGPEGLGFRLQSAAAHGSRLVVVGPGRVFRTEDDGRTWNEDAPPVALPIAVRFMSAGIGLIGSAAANGGLGRTVDGGVTWEKVATPTTRAVAVLAFADSMTAVAAGDASIRSTDGGVTWTALPDPGYTVFGIDFAPTSPGPGLRVGGAGMIERSTDAGATWAPVASGTDAMLRGVGFAGPTVAVAAGYGGTVLRTTDGGVTWTRIEVPTRQHLRAVGFANEREGIVVGLRGTILRTRDGGLTWRRENSGTRAHLFGAAVTSGRSFVAVGWQETILVEAGR